jgi:hypothetical protein
VGEMMKFFIKYIIIINIILLSVSCQSVVRFSSDSKTNINSTTRRSDKPKTKPIEGSLTKDKEFLETYRSIKPIRINIVREAESWIGTPYKYGGTTSSGFDCSGFVQTVFDKCGVSLPRTSQQQYTYTVRINIDELEPGDLIFFGKRGEVSHVGIFGGNGYMIHSSTSQGVVRQELQDYLAYQTIQGCGRPSFK